MTESGLKCDLCFKQIALGEPQCFLNYSHAPLWLCKKCFVEKKHKAREVENE